MKRIILIIFLFGWCLFLFPQQLQHETRAINIEVPVRVFEGDTFVDDLTIDDFEIYEDGVLQKIEAVYLIRKKDIKREETRLKPEEEKRISRPQVSRQFVFLFDIIDYLPKVDEAIDFFFEKVISPGDSLIAITPVKSYNLKDKSWDLKRKKEIARQLKGLLRKDVILGNSGYRNTIRDLENSVIRIACVDSVEAGSAGSSPNDLLDENSLDYELSRYEIDLKKTEDSRLVNQTKMIHFSKFLKKLEGQKHVFLFHQREFLPWVTTEKVLQYQSVYQYRMDILFKFNDLFIAYRRNTDLNVDLIKQAYSDASIAVHFLFVTKPPEPREGVFHHEQSEDVFSAFLELAHATGGLAESSANAAFAFKKAAEASENYYLLYYTPRDYKPDGAFKNIKVKVKGKNYRVMHRAGYIAN